MVEIRPRLPACAEVSELPAGDGRLSLPFPERVAGSRVSL